MSTTRIKGEDGVVIESTKFLELPKAPNKITSEIRRAGMIRWNDEWASFEGAISFTDGSIDYRRFAQLDSNGQLQTSQLPDSVTSGMQYMGTYSPVVDDIDPPVSATVYNPLPAPFSTNGQYYIVRGITDLATTHYNTNLPTTSPVTFTPPNPSEPTILWSEIKYYFGPNPVDTTKNIITHAFCRFVLANIPAIGAGHDGLEILATSSTELTDPFSTTNLPENEMALMDSDWVISNGTTNQRLRQSRISIQAGAVYFDRSMMYAYNRILQDAQTGTVQNVIDSLIINGLRRTGDAMFDNGGEGDGRLAFLYGTAAAPSLTFNSNAFDAVTNPGTDPTKWSDASTGIFHPATGSIGFSASGTERLRVEPQILKIMQFATASAATAGTVQFIGASNTNNLGITGLNNTFSFSTNNVVQVEFTNAQSRFHGAITVDTNALITGNATINGNTIIGDTSTDTLTVNATSTFIGPVTLNGNLTVKGNTILGDASTDTLTVVATSTFSSPVTISSNLSVTGNTIIGDASTDTLVVNAGSTFNAPTNVFTSGAQIGAGGTLVLQNANGGTTISNSTTEVKLALTSNNPVNFYDGSTLRSSITVNGIGLPVLSPVDNTKGTDGMIAYSPDLLTIIQRVSGTWRPVGILNSTTNTFTTSTWTLVSGAYTITYNIANAKFVQVLELQGDGSFDVVDIDRINITATTVTISTLQTPDTRFNGKCVVVS